MPEGFLQNASYTDCVNAVYHCLPRQNFRDVAPERSMITRMQIQNRPPKMKLPPDERLAIEHLKERLAPGVICSFPQSWVSPPSMATAVSLDKPAERPNIVPEALHIVANDSGETMVCRICRDYSRHLVLKILRVALERRIVQRDSGRRSGCIVASELTVVLRLPSQGGALWPATLSQNQSAWPHWSPCQPPLAWQPGPLLLFACLLVLRAGQVFVYRPVSLGNRLRGTTRQSACILVRSRTHTCLPATN